MPVVIKRYRNRKLYNTQSKSYITLNELEELIKQQEDIQVIENASGKDITAATLSQIIYESGKSQTAVLPVNLLISLIQSSGKRIDEIRRIMFNTLTLTHHHDAEIERRMSILIEDGDFQPKEGNEILRKLLSVRDVKDEIRENIEVRVIDFLRERQIPSKNEFHALIERIDSLSKRIDNVNINTENSMKNRKEDQIIE